MTGAAGTETSVEVDSPNAGVGPGCRIDERFPLFSPPDLSLLIFEQGNSCAMTLLAPIDRRRHPFNNLTQDVIEGSQDLCRLGVMALHELLRDVGMTAGTIGRCDDRGDPFSLMNPAVGVLFPRSMTLVATNAVLRMFAERPLLGKRRGLLEVTLITGTALPREEGCLFLRHHLFALLDLQEKKECRPQEDYKTGSDQTSCLGHLEFFWNCGGDLSHLTELAQEKK
jgi:hypothetical protein